MGKFDSVIEELTEQRNWMAERILEFKSGKMKHSELREGKWVDITSELVADFNDRVANLTRLIVAYEKHNDEN